MRAPTGADRGWTQLEVRGAPRIAKAKKNMQIMIYRDSTLRRHSSKSGRTKKHACRAKNLSTAHDGREVVHGYVCLFRLCRASRRPGVAVPKSATCLILPHLLFVLFIVSRIIFCYTLFAAVEENQCYTGSVRQVAPRRHARKKALAEDPKGMRLFATIM